MKRSVFSPVLVFLVLTLLLTVCTNCSRGYKESVIERKLQIERVRLKFFFFAPAEPGGRKIHCGFYSVLPYRTVCLGYFKLC